MAEQDWRPNQGLTIAETDLEESLARVKQLINQVTRGQEPTEADLKERAEQVTDWLRVMGIDPEEVKAKAKGKLIPTSLSEINQCSDGANFQARSDQAP